jgi:hypothetical protein
LRAAGPIFSPRLLQTLAHHEPPPGRRTARAEDGPGSVGIVAEAVDRRNSRLAVNPSSKFACASA